MRTEGQGLKNTRPGLLSCDNLWLFGGSLLLDNCHFSISFALDCGFRLHQHVDCTKDLHNRYTSFA